MLPAGQKNHGGPRVLSLMLLQKEQTRQEEEKVSTKEDIGGSAAGFCCFLPLDDVQN